MVNAWPVDLPQVLLADGFDNSVGDSRVSYPNDAGAVKQTRPRTSAVVDPLRGSMIMSTEQWQDLLLFGRTTLLRWTLPFTFPDPDGGSDLLVQFSKNLPSRSYAVSDTWKVVLDLEILP